MRFRCPEFFERLLRDFQDLEFVSQSMRALGFVFATLDTVSPKAFAVVSAKVS